MRSSHKPDVLRSATSDRALASDAPREIFIPHDPAAGPVTAVKNLLIQSSLAQLKANDHYERYVTMIAPNVLEDLLARMAPSWIPVELAMAHYEACENLNLNIDETAAVGTSVGDHLQNTTLVSRAKKVRAEDFDVWGAYSQMYRMWARLYQGGSVQVVRLGPKTQLIEQRGFPMNRFRYFRQAQVAAFAAAYEALGVELSCVKVERHSPARDEVAFRVAWY
jgi:hypothetical protein